MLGEISRSGLLGFQCADYCRLPTIKKTVMQFLENTARQLESLPEMPDNVEKEISVSLGSFNERARSQIEEFAKRFNETPNNFRECLIHMKPKFVLKDRSDAVHIDISSDDSDGGSVRSQNTPTKRRSNASHTTLPKRPRVDGPSGNGGSGASFNFSNGRGNSFVKPEEDQTNTTLPPSPVKRSALPAPFAQWSGYGSGFRTLAQVREEKTSQTRAGMPDRLLDEM